MTPILYVYAITREPVEPQSEAVDMSRNFGSISAAGVAAVYTPVDGADFSQEAIDSRAGDLEWLGAIGYRHQGVVTDLMKRTAIIPLRAFTLFSSAETLRRYLTESSPALARMLERLDGKQEWTLRIEFEPQRWSDAVTSRVDSLRQLASQIEGAPPGKAFLLRKKLDEEKKRATKDAELQVVGEIERTVLDKLRCETVAESRQQREGAFPQINVLINRDEEAVLHELHGELMDRYAPEGIAFSVSGPWPPYTFAGAQ
ncbi:MAG TPA: GvpL/GvpF family gas vesicle protein [Thermoanaerobaculia bacterium]|nr:GvpL/GvpF family gas vesicle protein [Thermoanaerobaculia bacterium]